MTASAVTVGSHWTDRDHRAGHRIVRVLAITGDHARIRPIRQFDTPAPARIKTTSVRLDALTRRYAPAPATIRTPENTP